MGSLNMPADRAALYTLKTTVGLVSQQGINAVSYDADQPGPFTKCVADLADLLDILIEPSKTAFPDGGYKACVTGSWEGIRVGYLDFDKWRYPEGIQKPEPACTQQMVSWVGVR